MNQEIGGHQPNHDRGQPRASASDLVPEPHRRTVKQRAVDALLLILLVVLVCATITTPVEVAKGLADFLAIVALVLVAVAALGVGWVLFRRSRDFAATHPEGTTVGAAGHRTRVILVPSAVIVLAIILSVPTFLKDSAEPLVSDDDRLRQAAQDLIDSGGMPTTTPPTPTENRYLTKLRSYPDIARVLGLTENYYVDALTRGQYICARFDDGRIKSSVIRDMVTGTTRDDIDVADANLIIRAATATLCPEHEAEGR